MTALLTRTHLSAPSLGRLSGHVRGVRQMNGELEKCSAEEREFRDRMMQLAGELLLLELAREKEEAAQESEVWRFIAGLHDVFGRDALRDDLIGLLLLTREARIAGDIAGVPEVLKSCVEEMAFAPHGEKLRLSCSRRLRQAGVDMNRGL